MVDLDEQLAPNFTLEELLRSDAAERDPALRAQQYDPPPGVVEDLRYLCQTTLQPIRDRLGFPIGITSGYRCDEVNRQVKGSATSQHRFGQAADCGLSPAFLEGPSEARSEIEQRVQALTGRPIRQGRQRQLLPVRLHLPASRRAGRRSGHPRVRPGLRPAGLGPRLGLQEPEPAADPGAGRLCEPRPQASRPGHGAELRSVTMAAARRRLMALVTSCLLLWPAGSQAFESELWPGEGVPHFAARSERLALHQEPDAASLVVTELALEPGDEIDYGRTLFRTVDEGLMIAMRAGVLFGRSLGDVEHLSEDRYYDVSDLVYDDIPYVPGDAFAYLQDRAEGTCLIRHHDAVLEIEACPGQEGAGGPFDLAQPPITEWWVEVTDAEDEPLGWLRIDETAVDLLPRTF